MELIFNKINDVYVCEFEVNGDFNLHIEKDGKGSVTMYQRGTAEGAYDIVNSVKMAYGDTVLDTDITALVYPKYIKLESYTENISGTVTEKA